eukprot:10030598-Lingulodinium_polyedra.AAC.1
MGPRAALNDSSPSQLCQGHCCFPSCLREARAVHVALGCYCPHYVVVLVGLEQRHDGAITLVHSRCGVA